MKYETFISLDQHKAKAKNYTERFLDCCKKHGMSLVSINKNGEWVRYERL